MTFNLTLSENERLMLLFCMGATHGVPDVIANKTEPPAKLEDLALRLMTLAPAKSAELVPMNRPATQPAPSSTPAGGAEALNTRTQAGAPMALADRWAKKADPATAETQEITPMKVDRKDTATGKRLVVSWQSNGRGYLQASCWDEALFGHIANRVKQKTTFYFARKGNYLNVVGLRA